MNQQTLSSPIGSVADLLRGDFKQSECGRVILPFTALRRLDCVLENTEQAVLAEYASKQAAGIANEPFVRRKAGHDFFNVSSLDMGKRRKPSAEFEGIQTPEASGADRVM